MSGKYALIIANTEYTDSGLAQLTAPGKDAKDFAHVLQEKDLCGFDNVSVLLNQPSTTVNEAIDDFFFQKKPDDLLLLYFSGHGVRDELGTLYLAVKNTNRYRLRVTAIKSDFIKESMDQSRSRRQVLILDCCNSGAFAQGAKAAIGTSIGTAAAFEGGYGRIVLTASDATQIAWEGDKIIGETQNSLFTHYLVKGLLGEADRDGNGQITVDELYDYAYEQVLLATPKQTPSKFSRKQQGDIILRKNMRVEDINPLPLPDQLLETLENPFSDVRLGAVRQLSKLADGKNLGMARSAMETLERVAKGDDSRTVSQAAYEALELRRKKLEIKINKPIAIKTPKISKPPIKIIEYLAKYKVIAGISIILMLFGAVYFILDRNLPPTGVSTPEVSSIENFTIPENIGDWKGEYLPIGINSNGAGYLKQSFYPISDKISGIQICLAPLNNERKTYETSLSLTIENVNREVLAGPYATSVNINTDGWVYFDFSDKGILADAQKIHYIRVAEGTGKFFGWKFAYNFYAFGSAYSYENNMPERDFIFRVNPNQEQISTLPCP